MSTDAAVGSGLRQADLVLEGGGVKGIGLLGAVTALYDAGYSFPRVAGTSAGAIVGSLVAACLKAGETPAALVPVMQELDYRRFRDETFIDHLGAPGKFVELLLARGIYEGNFLVDWLERQLAAFGVRTFADLRDDDPETGQPDGRRYRLVVMASDLSTGQLVRLPWDYHYYGLDPDKQRVVDAVRASMSIPFFFRPVTLDCPDKQVTLVDGGMLSNFPIDAFNRTDGKPPRWPTIGIKLSAQPGALQVANPTGNPVEFTLACLRTLLGAHDRYHLDDELVTQRTVFVDTMKVSSVDFDLTREQQQELYQSGRRAGAAFAAQFDWSPTAGVAAQRRPVPSATASA